MRKITRKITSYCRNFWKDESGLETMEFAVILIILVSLITILWLMADEIKALLDSAYDAIKNMVSNSGTSSSGGSTNTGGGYIGGTNP